MLNNLASNLVKRDFNYGLGFLFIRRICICVRE
jgi:hypothetical protein